MYYNQTEETAMGAKYAPPFACIVVDFEEKTELFSIELPKFFSTEKIKFKKEVFRRYMDDGFLFSPAKLNFDSFMICLNNLHPFIN